jgi:hypothetical protein
MGKSIEVPFLTHSVDIYYPTKITKYVIFIQEHWLSESQLDEKLGIKHLSTLSDNWRVWF